MKPETEYPARKKKDKPCLHLICSAHLDPVWQWRWEEGCAEALSTFRTAVQFLEVHGQFVFNHNESLLYEWVKDLDFPLFRRIQHLVEAGRWAISGGWYLQPDVNLPATESLIRHIAEGRAFFRKHFHAEPKVAYNFDSFGHSGGLPQILVQSGYKMYIHMRPQESELTLPSDLYRWRGVDGTEIDACRISVGLYHTEYDNIRLRLELGVKRALALERDIPVFWGIGDHGGGATREDLERIDDFIHMESRVRIVHSTPDLFYEAVKPSLKNIPVFEGDLQRVFTGCYTSLARLKRQAVKSIHGLAQAETLRAFTWWARKQEFPQETLHRAWKDHMFNDFHDILAGTCVEPAEKDALDRYGCVAETVKSLCLSAAVCLNQGPQRKFSIPLTILNTVTGLGRFPLEFECMLSLRPKRKGTWHMELMDSKGTPIPCQEEHPEALLPFKGWRRKVVFMPELPAVSITHCHLEAREGRIKQKKEKACLKLSMGLKSGLIEELGYEEIPQLLTGPLLQPLVIVDTADSWGTGVWSYRNIKGKMKLLPGSHRVMAQGPIRTIHEGRFGYAKSRLTMHTLAYARWPVLEYRLRILWNEEQKRLKLSIPTVIKAGGVLCEVPGGVIRKPADGEEHAHGRWLVLDGREIGMDAALGIVNSGQHGFDFKDGEIRLSVLRSAAYCHEQGFPLHPFPARKFMDLGLHEIRLLIAVGEPEDLIRRMAALADWLNAPPVVFPHLPIGTPEHVHNFLAIEPENIRMLACKRSWDGRALILRLQESCGFPTQARVTLHKVKRDMELGFKPLEIKTLRIESGRWREVKLTDET